MSSITTGVGIISGIPIQQLVDSLIQIQRAPIDQLQTRLNNLVSRKTALFQLSAQLLSARNAALRFDQTSFFRAASATSSDPSALLATAGADADVGSYTFTVRALARTHQLISDGFATRDQTPIGAGTITIESANAQLNRSTQLSSLHGGAGVQLGKLRITDRSGQSAVIDLTTAATIDDILTAINDQSAASVKAHAEGDRIILEDQTGLATGSLSVAEVGSGKTAASLGLLGSTPSATLTGNSLVHVTQATRLDDLNDGNGVRRLAAGLADFDITLADGTSLPVDLAQRLTFDKPLSALNGGQGVPPGSIRVTNRAGVNADVDLSAATTIQDVKTAIEAAGVGLSVTVNGAHLVIADASGGTAPIKIQDIGDGKTAAALGINKTAAGASLTGKDIYSVQTVGDVLRLINQHPANGGKLIAEINPDGPGIRLTDTTVGSDNFEVAALNKSDAAGDLGILGAAPGNQITSRRLLADLNTVLLTSLNGGSGVRTGQLQLTDRAGASAAVDLTAAQSLNDVLTAINAAGTGLRAAVSASGLGLSLTDESGGSGTISITDLSGQTALDLGIETDGAAQPPASRNLQRRYISETTRLDQLRPGVSFPRGRFRITDSNGETAVVDLTQGNEKTLQDVVNEINSRGIGASARINDQGDGLLIEDSAGGVGQLKIAEDGGTTASALGIFGQAAAGENFIDGSFETRIEVSGNDTLDDLLTKIRAGDAEVTASLINDGAASRPYRLSLSSERSGLDGALAVDSGDTGLTLNTLVQARDAVVLLGAGDSDSPLVITSSTNSLSNVVSGLKLDLIAPSDQPVTVSVSRNVDSIVSAFSTFVSGVNAVLSSLDNFTRFDPETGARGLLNGDPTAARVRDRLVSLVTRAVPGAPVGLTRLSSVGITLSDGAALKLDEAKLRQALTNRPADVEALFTHITTGADGKPVSDGLGALIKNEIDRLTKDDEGLIPAQTEAVQSSQDILSDRITQLESLLARRRERLLAQFNAMEATIARLQSQQSALGGLGALSLGA